MSTNEEHSAMIEKTYTQASELVAVIQRKRIETPVGNALLDKLSDNRLTLEDLRKLTVTELQCHRAEIFAYGTLIARFPCSPVSDLYIEVARLVQDAFGKLRACVVALGVDPSGLSEWPMNPDSFAYTGFVSWSALHCSQADNALGLYGDMTSYFPDCATLVAELRKREMAVPQEFFDYYEGGQSDELEHKTLDVVQFGLDSGDSPEQAIAHAWLMEEHISQFWQAVAAAV